MTETLVTTAEAELNGLLNWLRDGNGVQAEIRRRLERIVGAHDGWRSRCVVAEKRNVELVDELARVREELRDLKCANEGTETK